jgi:chorismate synthase
MSSTFGRLFRVSTFGESHGPGVGCVIDGAPARLPLTAGDIQTALDRRRPGQSALTSPRDEQDRVTILSGVHDGMTLGTPLALFVANADPRPGDYKELTAIPRPSHADYTYQCKYGIRAASGGGRASARETIGRVAAGAVAERFLQRRFQVEIVAWVSEIGGLRAEADPSAVTRAAVDAHATRCPVPEAAETMAARIDEARNDKDSLGGVVTCVCRGLPPGWGEPVFDKLEALLAHAMLSIPATKGFEIGSGFRGPPCAVRNTTTYMSRAPAARWAPPPTAAGASRADCPTASRCSSASPSNPPPPSANRRPPSISRARRWCSKPGGDTTRASSRAPCPSSKRWPRWCWPTSPSFSSPATAPRRGSLHQSLSMAMVRRRDWASGVLGRRTVSTPFLNCALMRLSSRPEGRGMLRWKEP